MTPEIFAYYFPNYHADARNARVHSAGWTEWELVKAAQPRFPGHVQPKKPLWGFEDEANPQVMARKIEAAASHGVTGFLFDWYWYEDGPFLGRALDEGFLGAANNDKLKFALMWANHDWINIHPATAGVPADLLYPGALSRNGFEQLGDFIVENYFSHPAYWKIDGCPYFSIYELASFLKGMGGVTEAIDAMNSLRAKVRKAGFPDLHLNIVAWGLSEWSFQVLPVESRVEKPVEVAARLGTASVTPYVWVHHCDLNREQRFPHASFAAAAQVNYASWNDFARLPFAFFPNVTMGWDSSPRTNQSQPFENHGYPFTPILEGNTPAAFENALRQAKHFLETNANAFPAVTINAWNEWTEGSYLEPDTENGYSHLEAIRHVFGR